MRFLKVLLQILKEGAMHVWKKDRAGCIINSLRFFFVNMVQKLKKLPGFVLYCEVTHYAVV